RELRAVPGLAVAGPDDFPPGRFDPTKLVVLLAGTGASGVAVEDDLIAAGLPVEMADHDTLVPIVSLADTDDTLGRLIDALRSAAERHRGAPRGRSPAVHWGQSELAATWPSTDALSPSLPVAAMTPRDAFFAPHRVVPADDAVGQVCAELVAPYPPGVPVL